MVVPRPLHANREKASRTRIAAARFRHRLDEHEIERMLPASTPWNPGGGPLNHQLKTNGLCEAGRALVRWAKAPTRRNLRGPVDPSSFRPTLTSDDLA